MGHGEGGAEDTLERLLDTVECGHLGGGVSTSCEPDRPHHFRNHFLPSENDIKFSLRMLETTVRRLLIVKLMEP